MAPKYWAVICPAHDQPELWPRWIKEKCLALGWSPSRGYKWDGPPTSEPDFELARKRAKRMSPGDIVIPYLCNWRFALPAKIKRLALADADVDPTGRGMSHPELPGFGRRIHVKWLKNGAPPLDKVAVVPDAFHSGPHRCMVAQTVEPLNPERYARFMRVIRNRHNWKTYEATYAQHRTGRNGANGAIYPDELPAGHNYYEGAAALVPVNKYERNPLARKACLAEHGTNCMVCGLSFYERYGAIGTDFIHVHHLKPLAALQRKYRVNPKIHLRPVCPNCHAMLHRRNPPFSIQQLKAKLRSRL